MLLWRAALLVVVLALVPSCTRSPAPHPAPPGAARIVSLSPSTTETLFAIGAGNRVVGRSRFCDYPEEAKSLPAVGGFADPSLEAIVDLRPDLVVGSRAPGQRALADKLGVLGIATFFPPTDSLAEIDAMIDGLGEKLGLRENAAKVVAASTRRRSEVARAVSAGPRVRALLVFETTPIIVAGPDSFPNEMIALANGQNVATSGGAYPTLNVEQLVSLDPDVIVNAAMVGAPRDGDGIGPGDPGWRELAAVREGRVVSIRDEAVLRPGPRVGDGLAVLARALHPGAVVP
jgi:iron complex transport system substrate-binding protein